MVFLDQVEFRHVGAVCTTVAGLFLSGVAYGRQDPDSTPTEGQEKAMSALRVIGPLVLAFGVLRFWTG